MVDSELCRQLSMSVKVAYGEIAAMSAAPHQQRHQNFAIGQAQEKELNEEQFCQGQ